MRNDKAISSFYSENTTIQWMEYLGTKVLIH